MSGHPKTLPAFRPDVPFDTLARVRTPGLTRWVGRLLLLGFVFSPVLLLSVPWQQTVTGRGQVVAFAPTERLQVITARVNGQIGKWHVFEGSKVKAGDRIVDIDDNDPGLAERLDEQRKFLQGRVKAANDEVAGQTRVVDAQKKAAKAAVAAAQANAEAATSMVDVNKKVLENNTVAVEFAKNALQLADNLLKDKESGGLVSRIARDRAKADFDRAETDVGRAMAEIKRAEATVLTNNAMVLQAEATGLSAVDAALRDLHRAEQGRFTAERELQEIDIRIERFKARFVVAPCDGVVHRVSGNTGQGGQYVKEGDVLAEILPNTTDRVIELFIDGLDAPLVAAFRQQNGDDGPHVRLQFEGWPGVQFAGWPSVAVGTFGGKVRQIDPTDDGYGRFRVLVEPDAMFEGDEWPEGIYLRQGNQAIGWVFLNRVTLGYELWRQLNGFPPVIAPKAPDKDKEKGGKPPKIKV